MQADSAHVHLDVDDIESGTMPSRRRGGAGRARQKRAVTRPRARGQVLYDEYEEEGFTILGSP